MNSESLEKWLCNSKKNHLPIWLGGFYINIFRVRSFSFMKKRNIFFTTDLHFLVACNSKLDKSDLDSYYTSLVDSYCDGLIPIYEEDLPDSKTKKNYENTLSELKKLQKDMLIKKANLKNILTLSNS